MSPTMIVMGVVGVGWEAAWPASLPRNSCRFMARARETDPPAPPVPRADRERQTEALRQAQQVRLQGSYNSASGMGRRRCKLYAVSGL